MRVITSNNLVRESYKLTKDQKILLAMIMADYHRNANGSKDYATTISMKKLYEICGSPGRQSDFYARIRKAARILFEKEISENGIEGNKHIRWISAYQDYKGEATLDLELSQTVQREVLDQEKNFTQYELSEIVALTNFTTMRLFEILASNASLGKYQTTPNDLREKLGHEGEYMDTARWRNVCLKALEEINDKTKLNVTMTYEKRGTRVQNFIFRITRKTGSHNQTGRKGDKLSKNRKPRKAAKTKKDGPAPMSMTLQEMLEGGYY